MNEIIDIDIDRFREILEKNKLTFDNQIFYKKDITNIEYLTKTINSLNNINETYNYYKEKMLLYIDNIELISKINIPDFKPLSGKLNKNELKQNNDLIIEELEWKE